MSNLAKSNKHQQSQTHLIMACLAVILLSAAAVLLTQYLSQPLQVMGVSTTR